MAYVPLGGQSEARSLRGDDPVVRVIVEPRSGRRRGATPKPRAFLLRRSRAIRAAVVVLVVVAGDGRGVVHAVVLEVRWWSGRALGAHGGAGWVVMRVGQRGRPVRRWRARARRVRGSGPCEEPSWRCGRPPWCLSRVLGPNLPASPSTSLRSCHHPAGGRGRDGLRRVDGVGARKGSTSRRSSGIPAVRSTTRRQAAGSRAEELQTAEHGSSGRQW